MKPRIFNHIIVFVAIVMLSLIIFIRPLKEDKLTYKNEIYEVQIILGFYEDENLADSVIKAALINYRELLPEQFLDILSEDLRFFKISYSHLSVFYAEP